MARPASDRYCSAMNGPQLPAIETPCVKVCVVDPETGYCIGCGRTRSEIGAWLSMSAADRRQVMDALPERMANLTRHKSRRGGRRGRMSGAL